MFTFFITVFYLHSCKKKTFTKQIAKKVITINPNDAKQEVYLSELVDSISYIKLETNPDCIMGKVREIIIKGKYIYAVDQSQMQVLVFDKKGKFISKLDKKGKGPDEYSLLGPVFISDDEKYIEVIDLLGDKSHLFKYSNIEFDLIDRKDFSAPSANSCRKGNDNIYYFSTQQIDNSIKGEITNADIVMVENSKIKKALFEKRIITNNMTFSPTSETFTKNKKNELFVSLMYNNTFFKLSNKNAYPILTVDFGEYSINNSIGLKSTSDQEKYLEKDTEGLASFPILNANDSNVLAFSYYFKENLKNNLHQYIKLKKSKKVFHTKEIVNDITSFPNNVFISSYFYAVNHEVLYQDFLVDIVLPWYHLKEEEIKVKEIGEIKINDNPIILLMKLKE